MNSVDIQKTKIDESINKEKFLFLKDLSFEDFKKFFDSLDDEKKTWSLDTNVYLKGELIGDIKNPKALKKWYDVFTLHWWCAIVYIDDNNEVLGLAYYIGYPNNNDIELANYYMYGDFQKQTNIKNIAQVSVVVNKKAQGKGIGTQLLREIEKPAIARGFDFFFGRRMNENIPAAMYQKKVGWNDWGSVYNYEKKWMTPQVYCGKLLSLSNVEKSSPDWPNNHEKPMTFCISTYNNFHYLKLAVKSVRKNSFYKSCPFVVYAENCTDGTNEWLEENKEKYNLEVYIEPNNKIRRGIGGGMNFCASKVKTEFINFLQADIYVACDWDLQLLRLHKEYVGEDRGIVFSQRVQPDIFNDSERAGTVFVPMDEFGEYYHNFDEEWFLHWCEQFKLMNNFNVRKGEGVSGLIRKEDWDYIGGNDDRFAPAYCEDMDLFIRMQNEDFKFMLTSESLIYHFASRSSRFPDDDLTKRPKELSDIEQNSMKEFIKKYGKPSETDENDFVKPMPIIDGSPNRIKQEIK